MIQIRNELLSVNQKALCASLMLRSVPEVNSANNLGLLEEQAVRLLTVRAENFSYKSKTSVWAAMLHKI